MKKLSTILYIILFGLVISFAHTNSLSAQNNNQETVLTENRTPEFSLKFGVNSFKVKTEISSSFFGDFSETSGSKFGLFGGLTADIPLTRSLSLQTELLYVQKGASSDEIIASDSDFFVDEEPEDGSVTFHYFDLPVLLKFNFDSNRNVVPSVYAGPYAGYRFHISTSDGEEIDDETESFFRTISSGIIFGGSLGFDNFIIDLRYDLGIRNLIDFDSILESADDIDDGFDDFFDELFGDLKVSNKFRGLSIGISFVF